VTQIQQIPLTASQESRLQGWLLENLQTIREKREARQNKWVEWRRQYEGAVRTTKDFPWKGASNVFVPITGIIVDAIHANMMNRLFSHDRIWDVSALHPKEKLGLNVDDGQPITWTDLAKAVQRYMQLEGSQQGTMDVFNTVDDAILQAVKLGTSVIYNPWLSLTQDDFVLDHASGEVLRNAPTTVFDGIRPTTLPLEDFLILPHYSEVHGPASSPLIGHTYWLRPGEVEARRAAGWYRRGTLDAMASLTGSQDDEVVKDAQAHHEQEPETVTDLRRGDYQLQDLWLKYPLKERGHEVRIFVTYHEKSNSIARVHPWLYKRAPYTHMRYLRREGRFYGIGVPEMLETIQKGVNTSFNQAVDNATIANMRCVKIRSGSQLARNFGDIYPGRKFYVDNVDDIKEFQLGEVYPSIFQVGLLLRDFAERRTGISDFNLGRESEVLGRSSTATTTMALLQESARRFDLYAKDIRRAVSDLGMQSLELTQQMKPFQRIHAVLGQDGSLAERALNLPQHIQISQHLMVTATSASSASNKQVMQQNAMTVFGLMVQYLGQMFELGSVMSSPQMPEPMRKLAYDMGQTGERLMQRVLEGFDMPDIAGLLPQLEGLLQNADGQGTNGGADPLGGVGGAGGIPGAAQGAAASGAAQSGGPGPSTGA
jgi:hypothetical protein